DKKRKYLHKTANILRFKMRTKTAALQESRGKTFFRQLRTSCGGICLRTTPSAFGSHPSLKKGGEHLGACGTTAFGRFSVTEKSTQTASPPL
ncbi:hypothetical protein, partial [Tamlana crocina]|uniref:hypothetical protein n=1 Tax=Tamlana crocina TaxID=393006 RepID=UPI001ADD66C3